MGVGDLAEGEGLADLQWGKGDSFGRGGGGQGCVGGEGKFAVGLSALGVGEYVVVAVGAVRSKRAFETPRFTCGWEVLRQSLHVREEQGNH